MEASNISTIGSTRTTAVGAIAMGIIQGLTEFLPVSSSGHLVLGAHLLELTEPSILFDAVLHVGTTLPILWLYRGEIANILSRLARPWLLKSTYDKDPTSRFALAIIVGTIPTALIGFFLRSLFEQLFASPFAVAIALLVTGMVLLLTARTTRATDLPRSSFPERTLTLNRGLLVGIAQGFAITPGISRSGLTIATGLLLGIDAKVATTFSFLLSLPAIAGATLLQIRHADYAGGALELLLGSVAAAISGYFALIVVIRAVLRRRFHWFTTYLWLLGGTVLVYLIVRG